MELGVHNDNVLWWTETSAYQCRDVWRIIFIITQRNRWTATDHCAHMSLAVCRLPTTLMYWTATT